MRIFNLILFVLLTTFGNSQTVDSIWEGVDIPHILTMGDTSFTKAFRNGDTASYNVSDYRSMYWSHFDSEKGYSIRGGSLSLVLSSKLMAYGVSGTYWTKYVAPPEIGPWGTPSNYKKQIFNFVYNRLDGIQSVQIDILGTEVNNAVVIAGHLVDTFEDAPFTHSFQDNFLNWQFYSINESFRSYSYLPPLNTYEEGELYYDLEKMINIFIDDYKNHLFSFTLMEAIWNKEAAFWDYYFDVFEPLEEKLNNIKISAYFESLEDGVLAKSYGIDNEEYIIIKVDPDEWMKANSCNKWYILYHELGHDVLNLRHGQGGRMMFNYPTKTYSWEDFFRDRNEMVLNALLREHPDADDHTKEWYEDYPF